MVFAAFEPDVRSSTEVWVTSGEVGKLVKFLKNFFDVLMSVYPGFLKKTKYWKKLVKSFFGVRTISII